MESEGLSSHQAETLMSWDELSACSLMQAIAYAWSLACFGPHRLSFMRRSWIICSVLIRSETVVMRRSHGPLRPVRISASTPLPSSCSTSAPPSAYSGCAEELLKLLNPSKSHLLIMISQLSVFEILIAI